MITSNSFKTLGLVAVVGLSWALLGGCSSKSDDDSGSGGQGGQSDAGNSGICSATCPKACTSDSQCETSQGELCCSLGNAGSICLDAQSCPRSCSDDSKCDGSKGEACVTTDLSSPKICASPSAAISTCSGDSDCSSGTICCGIYSQAMCLPPSECPQACATSSECNTGTGQVCCTTAKVIEPHLVVDGLCLDPSYAPCPKACDTSSQCNTSSGEICCDGVCSTSCPKSCKQSSDCTSPDARICCTSAVVRAPKPTHYFSTGPHCGGTAYTCSEIGQVGGSTYCSQTAGCAIASGSSGTCYGSAYSCINFDGIQSECVGQPGCTFDTSTSLCNGTAQSCSSASGISATACDAILGCYWETGAVNCTGTPVSCAQLTTTACTSTLGCQLLSN